MGRLEGTARMRVEGDQVDLAADVLCQLQQCLCSSTAVPRAAIVQHEKCKAGKQRNNAGCFTVHKLTVLSLLQV